MLHIPSLYIAESPLGGRGVFTAAEIPKNSIIEYCPVIILSEKDRKVIHYTLLHDYYFSWGEKKNQGCAIALGYGSLYNHKYSPNARYFFDYDNDQIEIHSRKKIKAGEEITVTYNALPKDKSPVWFDL
jgi:hypothetical protein